MRDAVDAVYMIVMMKNRGVYMCMCVSARNWKLIKKWVASILNNNLFLFC